MFPIIAKMEIIQEQTLKRFVPKTSSHGVKASGSGLHLIKLLKGSENSSAAIEHRSIFPFGGSYASKICLNIFFICSCLSNTLFCIAVVEDVVGCVKLVLQGRESFEIPELNCLRSPLNAQQWYAYVTFILRIFSKFSEFKIVKRFGVFFKSSSRIFCIPYFDGNSFICVPSNRLNGEGKNWRNKKNKLSHQNKKFLSLFYHGCLTFVFYFLR